MPTKLNLTVIIDGPKVTLELPEEVYRQLTNAFHISPARSVQQKGASKAANLQHDLPLSEREIVEEKSPRGHAEIVAVLAYCLRERGTLEFTADDIRRSYIRAGVRPPKVVAQALRDAKNKYELIEFGSKKSTFRLSPHGERTVLFDLPRAK